MKLPGIVTANRRVVGLAFTLLVITLIAGCGVAGDDGQTYLAVDWVSAPQALYFPEFPQTIYAGEHEEHAAGEYQGEYIAWDGTYWQADYWIEVDRGAAAPLVGTGDHGDDYYMTMWLYSFGPSMYTDDMVVRSLHERSALVSTSLDSVFGDVPAEIVAARERTVSGEPIYVRESRRFGTYVVTVSACGYPDNPENE